MIIVAEVISKYKTLKLKLYDTENTTHAKTSYSMSEQANKRHTLLENVTTESENYCMGQLNELLLTKQYSLRPYVIFRIFVHFNNFR